MNSSSREKNTADVPRRRARASTSLKESIREGGRNLNNGCADNLCRNDTAQYMAEDCLVLESDGVDNFFEDSRLAQLKRDLVEVERFYLRKISAYRLDFESERGILEKELESSRTSHLNMLLKLKQAKDRITELETKNLFYKSRLKKFEEP
jgi:hypothetical protein